MEEVDETTSEPVLEKADEQPSVPAPKHVVKNQIEPSAGAVPPLEPEPENSVSGSEDMTYVLDFGWITSQGAETKNQHHRTISKSEPHKHRSEYF